MFKFIITSLIGLFLLHSCVKEDPEPEPEQEQEIPAENISAEATIGPEGGELAIEDFILSVPEGAFETPVTLSLIVEEEVERTDPKQVTEWYCIEGLNTEFIKPLEFSIRYEGELEGESAIAFGFHYFDEETGDSVWVKELVGAVDSAGFLTGTLAMADLSGVKKKTVYITDGLANLLVMQTRLLVCGISKIDTFRSEYAEIRYDPAFFFSRAKVEQFAQYIDDAVNFFDALQLIKRPVLAGKRFRVNIIDPGRVTAYPIFTFPRGFIINPLNVDYSVKVATKSYLISINGDFFSVAEDNKLRMLAAEGVLRFCNGFNGLKMNDWLQYSILYWAKRYFYGAYPLLTDELQSYETIMQPYYGMNADQTNRDIFPNKYLLALIMYHGDGLSPLICYLLDHYNDDFGLLHKWYKEIIDPDKPNHPIDILLATMDTPENIWWPEFFKAYLEGEIWEIPVYRFQEKIEEDDKVDFATEADSVKYLDRMYPDLSARLFQVNFLSEFPEQALEDGDKLSIKIEPHGLNLDYVKVLVHSFEDAKPILLGEGAEVVIENLKEFIDGGNRTLLVTLVNSGNEPPYKEDMEIQLTLRVVKEKNWNWKNISVEVEADAVFISNAGDETSWDGFSYLLSDKEMTLNEEGTLLYTSWIEQTPDYKYEGGIDIDIDPLSFEITGFYLWSNSESYSDGMTTLTEKTAIRGKEGMRIPVVYQDSEYLTHQLSGTAACPAIGSWSYEYASYPGESYEYTNTLTSYTCSENAALVFFWSSEGGSVKGSR